MRWMQDVRFRVWHGTGKRKARIGLLDRRRGSERGFTLVEMLAVVAIIGVLAAAAAPRVGSSILDSRRQNLLQEAATLQQALEAYASDNGAYLPTTGLTVEAGTGANVYTGTQAEFYDWLAGFVSTPDRAYIGLPAQNQLDFEFVAYAATAATGASWYNLVIRSTAEALANEYVWVSPTRIATVTDADDADGIVFIPEADDEAGTGGDTDTWIATYDNDSPAAAADERGVPEL